MSISALVEFRHILEEKLVGSSLEGKIGIPEQDAAFMRELPYGVYFRVDAQPLEYDLCAHAPLDEMNVQMNVFSDEYDAQLSYVCDALDTVVGVYRNQQIQRVVITNRFDDYDEEDGVYQYTVEFSIYYKTGE